MWFSSVDIPEEVVEAHQEGTLVLFVGAGVSVRDPSNLPSFMGLTQWVADKAMTDISERDLTQPDIFLAELDEDRDVDVHRLVAQRLGTPESLPNAVHEVIVRIAESAGAPRIVTTNYDRHLSRAADLAGLEISEYVGPALPLGNDFCGLVYLHGALGGDPDQLIVTDSDLGRAYLTDAWAARFLEPMFRQYTVLFIGYSHTDVVMRYLARGLRNNDRFVLTDDPDSPWDRLGISAIGYENGDGSHDELLGALQAWDSRFAMGLIDHRQRVSELTRVHPSSIPEENSYLESILSDTELVRFFTESADSVEWLDWIAKQQPFNELFVPATVANESQRELAYWYARKFVVNEEKSSAAFEVLRHNGGTLCRALWNTIGHHLHILGDPRPIWLRRWVAALVSNDPGDMDWLEFALLATDWDSDSDAGLLLIEHLARPMPRIGRRSTLGAGRDFEARTRGHEYWLGKALGRMTPQNRTEHAADLLRIADSSLRSHYRLLVMAGADYSEWDPLGLSRSGIEPHSQDTRGHDLDSVIDLARDALESLLRSDPDAANRQIESWRIRPEPLLRRLALHGQIEREDLNPSSKLEWLIATGWLWEPPLRHEVYRLIERALPDAESEVVGELIVAATTTELVGDYERFNLLVWLERFIPTSDELDDSLSAIRSANPDFQERDHPDLLTWMTVGWSSDRSDHSPGLVAQKVQANPSDAHHEFASHLYTDDSTAIDPSGLLGAVTSASAADAEIGFLLVESTESPHPQIVRAVVSGWTKASLERPEAKRVLTLLADIDIRNLVDVIADLLSSGVSDGTETTQWQSIPESLPLAQRLWPLIVDEPVPEGSQEWLSIAINHPAGKLAEFWSSVVAAQWRAAEDWQGLPEDLRDPIESAMGGAGNRSALFSVVVASQALFYFSADREWWNASVLPLFDWTMPETAARSWDGFTIWGRWNDAMLNDGLYEQYLNSVSHFDRLSEEAQQRILSHLASVCLISERNPLDEGLLGSLVTSLDVDQRVIWADAISHLMADLPTEAVDRQWNRWMAEYWQNRLDSVPIRMTLAEATSMASWAALQSEHQVAAVTLATSHDASLDEHGSALHYMTEDRLVAIDSLAGLLQHLLKYTELPFYACHELRQVLERLRPSANRAALEKIDAEAMRLRCGNGAP